MKFLRLRGSNRNLNYYGRRQQILMLCSLVVEWKTTVEEKPVCAVVDISAFNQQKESVL